MLSPVRRHGASRICQISRRPAFSVAVSKQRSFSSTPRKALAPDGEIDRACGVPETSTEAGPREPAGIFSALKWVAAGGAIASLTTFYFLLPSSASASGQAMQQRSRADRLRQERREGYEQEEETDAMREMEAGLILDAKEKKAREAKAKN